MATIKEVAKRAGVAISTVSAVINRSAPVSDAVLERVQKAIADIGYVPHGAAQSLRSGQSRMVGVIVPDVVNPHFAMTARVIENMCLSAGYMSVVFSSGQDPARESNILKMMHQQRVAGLIIIPTRSDEAHGARLLSKIHVPAVLLDMFVEGLPFDVVKLDNVAAGRMATEHLIGLGHKRIALMCGLPDLVTNDDRVAGYLEALGAAGLKDDEALHLRGNFDQETAYRRTMDIMQSGTAPTAFVSLSNMMTLGIMLALRRRGAVIPNDISLVGIDDFDFAEIMAPPPTVVAVPIREMATQAIETLMAEITTDAKPAGRRMVYQPTLIERSSTKALTAEK